MGFGGKNHPWQQRQREYHFEEYVERSCRRLGDRGGNNRLGLVKMCWQMNRDGKVHTSKHWTPKMPNRFWDGREILLCKNNPEEWTGLMNNFSIELASIGLPTHSCVPNTQMALTEKSSTGSDLTFSLITSLIMEIGRAMGVVHRSSIPATTLISYGDNMFTQIRMSVFFFLHGEKPKRKYTCCFKNESSFGLYPNPKVSDGSAVRLWENAYCSPP